MAWWVPLAAIGASLAGSLLAGGTGSQASPSLTGTGWVQGNTAPAMGDYTSKTLALAASDEAPSDFRIKIGDQEFPVNLAAKRRNQIVNSAAQVAGNLFRGATYEPLTQQASDPLSSLLPLALALSAKGLGSGSGSSDAGTISPGDYWNQRAADFDLIMKGSTGG